ncbi:MAG: Stk1 family PASTA domain-containing Ser/Thr kinase [Actinomycetaceae bacterium]|nr:Stk1 family PASTA domain-containing Ser/Thr kinase [Actinomycetaceae bacterium]
MAEIPRTLGNRYDVGDLIGRGGMAEVRLGYDNRLSRSVAIKVLRADLARDSMFLARFRREAQSSAALNHPSIVSVYDTGEETIEQANGEVLKLPYIVMEYVKGRTVASLLADGDPVPIAEAVQITAGVLSALQYSHNEGIIHRDIKPGNVMLTPDGKVKVMDFGIARAIADSAATMTQTNSVVGTAQYLSPEQARGEVVDARSDLYSAGCLLYELLTGKPPFTGDSAVAVAYQHVSETPTPASAIAPDIPNVVDRVVMKALAKNREERYQSADEFRDDLLSAAQGGGVMAPSVASWANNSQATSVVSPVSSYSSNPYIPATGEYEAALSGGEEESDDNQKKKTWLIAGIIALLVLVGVGLWFIFSSSADGKEVAPTASASATDDNGKVQVPEIEVGLSEDAVKEKIQAAGLVYQRGEDISDDSIAEGGFVKSSPASGTTLNRGALVTAHFSSGPAAVPVPDLTGKTTEEARRILENLGLKLGEVTSEDNLATEKDAIIRQTPSSGELAPGNSVRVTISTGYGKVPDVSGLMKDEAVKTLNQAGIKVSRITTQTSNDVEVGEVIHSSPSAGQAISRGESVELVIAIDSSATGGNDDMLNEPNTTSDDSVG